jgi:hypothetical protein
MRHMRRGCQRKVSHIILLGLSNLKRRDKPKGVNVQK